jgi:ATP-binding protein involved in chromosome partitioning
MSDLSPTGIDIQDSKSTFVVSWDDGTTTRIGYRELRLACRCALCIEEMTGKAILDASTVPDDIGVATCEEVGLYGVQIGWTTGHSTGIYTWERLRAIGGAE